MFTSSCIHRFIFALPLGKIFTTRQVLIYGSRAATDQALFRLVKAGRIIRLARGVFIKEGSKFPTPFEVAHAKYLAFKKQVVKHGIDLANDLAIDLAPELANKLKQKKENIREVVFATVGRSSSFRYKETLIRIKGISSRKMQLNQSAVGQGLAALWYLGKDLSTKAKDLSMQAREAFWRKYFLRDQRLESLLSRPLMPEWLACDFTARKYMGFLNPDLSYSGRR